MWDKTHHEFGQILPEQTYRNDFIYKGTKKIKKLVPSCKCTSVYFMDFIDFGEEKSKITTNVRVSIKESLPHYRQEKWITRNIEVIFEDGSKDHLTFRAKLVHKYNVKVNG